MFLRLFLGGSADSVYVSEEANDRFNSELKPELCKSFTFALNNVSRHNDTIPGGRTCQILCSCEHTIVIKYSLTITKFPKSSITPATTDRFKETNYLKNFFCFHKFCSDIVVEVFILNFNAADFDVNIFTTSEESIPARENVTILDSVIRSPSDPINLGDVSGYGNVSIRVKDSAIKNRLLRLHEKRKRCTQQES